MSSKLAQQVQEIQERNKRVESDKAWETSWLRRIIVAILTYAVIVVFFISANLPNPYANALVPTLAFILSTSTLALFKNAWLKARK